MKFLSLVFIFFLIGCDIIDNKKNKSNSDTNFNNCIRVSTLGNVVNAVVTDANNQKALYDENSSKYCFLNAITYPIKAQILSTTYIDVDYDNIKSANDIKPKATILKSYYPYIDLITDIHSRAVEDNLSYYNSTNSTIAFSIDEVKLYYENRLNDEYNINLANPSINEQILNFVAYDYNLTNSLNIESQLFDSYNNLVIFFDNYLNIPSIDDEIKYYSFFHSLELLDKHLINRVDTIHRPQITYIHQNEKPLPQNFISQSTNIIAKDIKEDDNGIYIAGGVDGVLKLNTSLSIMNNKKVSDTFSNSYNLDILKTNTSTYLLVADGGEGLSVFDITGGNFIYKNKIFWKYYDEVQGKDKYITINDSKGMKQIDEITNVKSYISPFENKILVAFGTKNTGLYLIDFKKVIPSIESNNSYPMIVSNSDNDIYNNLLIAGDGGRVYSMAFSSDGENLYATKSNIIEKYNISSLPLNSPSSYSIKGNNAYNLKMITKNGIDELFVSTNKGIEVYDVLNNGDLNFISQYNTEGAESGYLPKMDFVEDKNILLVTDGYKGLKAIKFDSSYNPRLCGIGYFYPYSDENKLAKVTSVNTYKDSGVDYVVVGIEGFGVAKFRLEDLLFKHCK